MTQDTWTTRDLPVLRAVVDIYDGTGRSVIRLWDIEAAVGLDEDTVQRALRALNMEPFFEKVTEAYGGRILMAGRPTANALRVAGAWPAPEKTSSSGLSPR